MGMLIRLSELARMTQGQQERVLTALVRKAKAPRSGHVTELDRRLREFELRYEMSSDEMLERFARGELRDTADIARWSLLAHARRGLRSMISDLRR